MMESSNEDLAREIKELREEVRQMKEIVSALLTMVVESEEDEDESAEMFPSGIEGPRMNN
jgi:cell division septum initiation protein DivIVA